METVRAFNNELSGLYETKPPISRAKMALVTKCAIKAIKFYKHVVQSVEKFIQKCKPEYKVPGLYVIDSVVRQSRHQFGHQKDVFVPRFTRNIINTFQNLFKCPAEERSKIVRVLNLWQKNEVFPSEIVQPLLDLAADPTKPSLIAAAQEGVDKVLVVMNKNSGSHHNQQEEQNLLAPEPHDAMESSQSAAKSMLVTQNEMLNTVTQLLQQSNSGSQNLDVQQQQLQQLQLLQQQLIQQTELMQQPTGGAPLIDANLLGQIQALTNQLLQKTESKPDEGCFRKKLLDFDYAESDVEEGRQEPEPDIQGDVQTILNDQGLMQQIQHVSQTIQKNNKYSAEISEQEHRHRILVLQQAEFDQQIMHGMPPPPLPFGPQPPMPEHAFNEAEEDIEEQVNDEDFHEQQRFKDPEDRDRHEKKHKTEDRSRSRTPKRPKRSRSRSRDHRRRSRSKDSHKRSRSKERSRKEKERERKKKALPAVRANFVTICTATIWIGHLNKFTSEEELRAELERFGTVDNISMVPPRGCAYVVMENRQDAYKAIDWLKGFKLNGSLLKTAWAQSTGMRESEFKDSWDLDEGAMYLPWDHLPSDLSVFLDGAIIDVDSLPQHLQNIPTEKVKKEVPMLDSTTQSNQFGAQMPPMMSFPGQPSPLPPLPGQPPIMGIMPPPMHGMMPGMMSSMMSGMVMSMQRPMMPPGLPPPALTLTSGLATPPSGAMPPGPPITPGSTHNPVVPGSAHVSTMPPGVTPVGGVPMSIASSVAATLAQTLQTIMSSSSAGMMPSSPAAPPRPTGFTPGGPPNFGFNLSMPPPGFRMPPPGFGGPMRPVMPSGPMPLSKPGELIGHMRERPLLMTGTSQKQAEMVWPPDSNEKDDEHEEDDDDVPDVDSDPQSVTVKQFSRGPAPNRPPRPGREQSRIRMLGLPPPGGFPPGRPPKPANQLWGMNRMAGPRQTEPLLGSRPNIRPLMGGPPMGSSRGLPFIGNSMLGGQFQRFPNSGPRGQNSNIRGPVSLFDLNVKPTERFEGETFHEDQEINDNEENFEENPERTNSFNKYCGNTEENEPESNAYPLFNSWQSMNRNQSKNSFNQYHSRGDSFRDSGNNRNFDRSRGSYGDGRNTDCMDMGRDDQNLHNMGRDRLHDRDRDGRDRERRDYGNREHVDRDWRGRYDSRDDERKDHDRDARPQDQDKQKVRKSRWGNWEEEIKLVETANKENCLNIGKGVETNISDGKQDSSDCLENVELSIQVDKNENRDDAKEKDILSKNSTDMDAECGKTEEVNKMKDVKGAHIDNKCDMVCFSGMDESKIEIACVTDKNVSNKEEGEIENTSFDDTTVKKYIEKDLGNVEKIVDVGTVNSNEPDGNETAVASGKSSTAESEIQECIMNLEDGGISN